MILRLSFECLYIISSGVDMCCIFCVLDMFEVKIC